MDGNYSLSDIGAVTNGNGMFGNNGMLILLFLIIMMGGGIWNRNGDYGQYATAASQQEILFGQQFQNIDNKIDRIGNGIADATFALNNSIKDGNAAVASAVINEGRNAQARMNDIMGAVHNEGEATRALIQQNKIETLQSRINQLELNNAMCGVVRYPQAWTYNAGQSPFCGCNNGCCN